MLNVYLISMHITKMKKNKSGLAQLRAFTSHPFGGKKSSLAILPEQKMSLCLWVRGNQYSYTQMMVSEVWEGKLKIYIPFSLFWLAILITITT